MVLGLITLFSKTSGIHDYGESNLAMHMTYILLDIGFQD